MAQPVPAGLIDAIVAESLKLPARVWQAYLEAMLEADVPTETGTIDAPTVILWGDQDAFCRRSDQDGLLSAIPGAQLAIYPGTGHCPHWEQPERTAADLVAFVSDPDGHRRERAPARDRDRRAGGQHEERHRDSN